MTIGERIKEVRKSVGLTQQAFADRLNLKRNTVGSYEVNVIEPSDRTIQDICRKFHINEDWLRMEKGEMIAPLSKSEKIAAFLTELTAEDDDDFRKRFVEMLADMPLEDWKLLERMADRLQKKEGNP